MFSCGQKSRSGKANDKTEFHNEAIRDLNPALKKTSRQNKLNMYLWV